MMYDGGFFFGMHAAWWIFWGIVIAVVVFALLRPSGSTTQAPRETPRETAHEVLRRRYAAGELTTQEYEERKAVLDRDVQAVKSGGPPH